MGKESIKSMKSHTQKGGYSKCGPMSTSKRRGGRGVEKSVIKYVLYRWPQTNVVEYFLCIGPAKYTRASPSARQEKLS